MAKGFQLLVIEQHNCTCGNKWNNSYAAYTDENSSFVGGRPLPHEADRLPFISYRLGLLEYNHHHSGCFRCVPLQLGVGWQKPPTSAEPLPSPLPKLGAEGSEPEDILKF